MLRSINIIEFRFIKKDSLISKTLLKIRNIILKKEVEINVMHVIAATAKYLCFPSSSLTKAVSYLPVTTTDAIMITASQDEKIPNSDGEYKRAIAMYDNMGIIWAIMLPLKTLLINFI